MASIRDVAELAQVSTATVSHVINHTRYVSPELTERVRVVMLELNYQPDAVARSLRRRETLTIGLLIPSVEIPFFAAVAYNVERAASEYGYNIILCNSDWQQAKESLYLRDLIARRVDGLVCISAGMDGDQIAPLIEAGTPVVMVERSMSGIDLDAVGIDNFKGAYKATKHLLDLGCRRIAVVTGMTSVSDQRVQGYQQALTDAGITPKSSMMFNGDYLPESGRQGIEYFLSLPEKPTGIFAFNDMMALGVLQVLNERGLRVPEDIAVLGFDGIPLSQYTSPALTTIRQPLKEMGRAAVEQLLKRIRGEGPEQAQYIKLEPELLIRASTGNLTAPIPQSLSENFTHA